VTPAGTYGGLDANGMNATLRRLHEDLTWLGKYWKDHTKANPRMEGTIAITGAVAVTAQVVIAMLGAMEESKLS
jgi:hypothetical protein